MIIKSKPTEDETTGLIQFLGDITIKSVSKHETEAAKAGIDSLTKIALKFLELKNNNEKRYRVESRSVFFTFKLKNQFISHALEEFDKIFTEGIKQKDSNINRYLIFQLFSILDKTMRGANNWAIFEELVDTRNVRGSTCTKLLEHSLEGAAALESNLLTRTLVDIPQQTIFEGKYHPEYVTAFINYHIYRMTRLVIDHDNFQTFRDEMEHFFNSLSFRDPAEIAGRISSNIYTISMSDLSEAVTKKTEELAFDVEFNCFKDFTFVAKLSEKIDEYKKILSESATRRMDLESIQQHSDRIKIQLKEFYISLLIYGVFFKIGSLIISKGPPYARYMEDLWYHGRPKTETGGIILNSTPVSESINWLTLYTLYSGEAASYLSDFYTFENLPDAESYHYQYCALMMIRLDTTFSLDMNQIDKIKSKRGSTEFQYYYELALYMKVDRFLDAVNAIEKNVELLSIIRRDIKKTIEIIKNTKDRLKQLKENQNKVRNLFAKHGEIDPNKIDQVKNQLMNKYLKDSISEIISSPKYDVNLTSPNLIKIDAISEVPREFFIEQTIISKFLLDPPVSDLASKEMNEIFKVIQSGLDSIYQDTLDFAEQVKANVRLLKNSGKNPNVIFIPLDVEMELLKKGLIEFGLKRKMKIDDIELNIINSWKEFDFTDIIILDPNCLKITYKAENREKRIEIQESNLEEGKSQVLFTSKTTFLVEIIEPQGFVKIINRNVAKLKKNADT